ncbi:protein FAM98A-like [Pelobates fuscus]|uniref:protein FAM98A-like n=1 Tax=Pelobates fuscus TaxID=191477 RepID=UPI002FE433C9
MECDMLENDVLESLEDLGYKGSLMDEGALIQAASQGALSQEYTKLCAWLVTELKSFSKLEENVEATNSPAESKGFQLEMSGLLTEMSCPYACLTSGEVTKRLLDKRNCLLLLTYLISELEAPRNLCVTMPSKKEKDGGGSEVFVELKSICMTLGMSKPPANITMFQFFRGIEKKLKETFLKVPPNHLGKPLLSKTLGPSHWEKIEAINQAISNEYEPPPPEMPPWQKRNDGPPQGGSRGGGRGGYEQSYSGRGGYDQGGGRGSYDHSGGGGSYDHSGGRGGYDHSGGRGGGRGSYGHGGRGARGSKVQGGWTDGGGSSTGGGYHDGGYRDSGVQTGGYQGGGVGFQGGYQGSSGGYGGYQGSSYSGSGYQGGGYQQTTMTGEAAVEVGEGAVVVVVEEEDKVEVGDYEVPKTITRVVSLSSTFNTEVISITSLALDKEDTTLAEVV